MTIFSDLIKYGEKTALINESDSVSYNELCKTADAISSFILNDGSDYKSTNKLIVNFCNNGIESVAGYVAFTQCSERANCAQMLVNHALEPGLRSTLLKSYKPLYIWINKASANELCGCIVLFEHLDFVLLKTDYDIDYELSESLSLLLTTSGSTGSPKLVRLSDSNIKSNTDSIVEYLAITSSDKPIMTLPMSYTYGLSILNTHLSQGCAVVLTDSKITDRTFWKLFNKTQPTTFGGVPLTYETLELLDFESMDVPSLKILTQAGGRLEPDTAARYAEICKEKGIKFFIMYGQTEATARMSYMPPEYLEKKPGSVGIAVPGGRFRLENDGVAVSENAEGELIYEGANVSLGYALNCYDLDKDDENCGVLHTGDVAKRDSDGFYYITGRLKRFLKIAGTRVNLDEVQSLLSAEGYETAVCGSDDSLLVFTTSEKSVPEIKEYVSKKLGISSAGYKVEYIKEIPRNESGKIMYSSLA